MTELPFHVRTSIDRIKGALSYAERANEQGLTDRVSELLGIIRETVNEMVEKPKEHRMKPIEEPAAVNAMRDAQAIAFAKALQTGSAPKPHHVARPEGELLHIEQPDLDALDAAAIERVESEPVPSKLLADLDAADPTDHDVTEFERGYYTSQIEREAKLTTGLPNADPTDPELYGEDITNPALHEALDADAQADTSLRDSETPAPAPKDNRGRWALGLAGVLFGVAALLVAFEIIDFKWLS